MLEKIKTADKKALLSQLRDTRTLGLLVFVVLVLLVSWSGIKSIQTNYELQRTIARLEQES